MNKASFYFGDQNTSEWHNLRLGLFTSSEIYKLFTKPTKERRAKAATKQVSGGLWPLSSEIVKGSYTTQELRYSGDYLVKYNLLTPEQVSKAKASYKAMCNFSEKKTSLLLRLCYAVRNVQAYSASFYEYCEDKAIEIAYNERKEEVNAKSLSWGRENEPLALFEYQRQTFNFSIKRKISFAKIEEFQTGSSPDFVYSPKREVLIPVECKCPISKKIHLLKHCKIKDKDDLIQFSKQKAIQIQHQIFTLGSPFGVWLSYDKRLEGKPRKDKILHYVKIEKDKEIQDNFIPLLKKAVSLRDEILNSI